MAYQNKREYFRSAIPVPGPVEELPDFLAPIPAALHTVTAAKLSARRQTISRKFWLYLGFAMVLALAYVRLDEYIDAPPMSLVLVMTGALPAWAAIAPRKPIRRR